MENYLDEKGDFFYFNFAIKKNRQNNEYFWIFAPKLILEFSRIFGAKIQIFFVRFQIFEISRPKIVHNYNLDFWRENSN